ncbi:MAG: hypothetical protein RIC16_12510 [Rhodospirillales bacterium]
MTRDSKSEIRVRAAVNETIAAYNRHELDSAREQTIRIWNEHYGGSPLLPSDFDVVTTLWGMMQRLAPDCPEAAAAQEAIKGLKRQLRKDQPLNAVYDLGRWPPQFDLFTFLVQAKTLAVAQDRPLNVVFQPAEDGGYVKMGKYSHDEANYRMYHICLPATILYGASPMVLPDRNAPLPEGDYLPTMGATHDGVIRVHRETGRLEKLRASKRGLELVGEFTERFDRPIVTITLRNTFRYENRNSDLTIWREVADKLMPDFQTVFVPDTADAFKDLDFGHAVFNIGAVDLDSRLALYERAALNIFNHNGPAVLCQYGVSAFLNFGLRDEKYMTAAEWASIGMPIDTQPPYLLDNQKLVWDPPTPERVIDEVREMMERI